jgi:hypothetical protein
VARGSRTREVRELLRRAHAQLAEPPRRHQHPRLQRADEPIIRGACLFQVGADVLHVIGEHRHAVVELGAERAHLFRALRQAVLLPRGRHRAQQRQQGERRGGDHPLIGGEVEQ